MDGADKTAVATLSANAAYTIDTNAGSATVTIANVITNWTLPTVTVVATTNDARELNLVQGSLTFTRTGATTDVLRVFYYVSGTASQGVDYQPLPGYIDIPAGQFSAKLPIIPINDGVSEPTETVIITLSAGNYQVGSSHTGTVYIDDSSPVSYVVQAVRSWGTYDPTSAKAQPTVVRVTRQGSTESAASIPFIVTNSFGVNKIISMSISGDVSGQNVTFAAHQSVATLSIVTFWSTYTDVTESPYIVFPSLSQTLPLHYTLPSYLVGAPAVSATQVLEGSSTSLRFRRPYPNSSSLTMMVSLGGTATFSSDYNLSTSITFPANQAYVDVPVTTVSHAAATGWKSIVITIGEAANQVPQIGAERALVRIQDAQDAVTDCDTDGDGLFDGWELSHGLDPLTANDATLDSDVDGLSLAAEQGAGTDPNVANPPAPTVQPTLTTTPVTFTVGASSSGQGVKYQLGAGPFGLTNQFFGELSSKTFAVPTGTNFTVILNHVDDTNNPNVENYNRFVAIDGEVLVDDPGQMLGFTKETQGSVPNLATNKATLYTPRMEIVTDANRDGKIDFLPSTADATTSEAPYTFWINDDADSGSDDTASDLDPSTNAINSADSVINGLRDLEDFSRIQLKAMGLPLRFLTNSAYQTRIYLTNMVGMPSLRFFPASDANGGVSYLTNLTSGTAQVAKPTLGLLTNGTPLTLPLANWLNVGTNGFFLPMLFEGISTGQCMITFGIVSNSGPVLVMSSPLYLSLKRVTDLYEHWTVGDNTTTNWISPRSTRTPDSAVYGPPVTNDDLDYLLFVHGWRLQPWERRAYASTAFKRLWHLGYKGRFGLYSWPTDYTPPSLLDMSLNPATRQNYDRSEQRAWSASLGLWELLVNLNRTQPGRVRLLAHCMGNIVASEALHLRGNSSSVPLIHSYIATQASSVAQAYDAVNPEVVRPEGTPGLDTPEVYAAFPHGNTNEPYFSRMTNATSRTAQGIARTYNFHNKDDYMLNNLNTWPANQLSKPDFGYDYDGETWWRTAAGTNAAQLHLSTDYGEIFAHLAQARSKALGCSEDATHIVRGEIGASVNLAAAPFSFTSGTNDHSAQFNSVNMNRRAYWWQVLGTFSLTNNLPTP